MRDSESGFEVPSDEYLYMMDKWELPLALMGGLEAMRAAGTAYLPKEPRESKEAYKVRLMRTNLYNVFRKTITSSSGQALRQPLVIKNVPDELKFLRHNATGDGRSIMELADDLIQHHLLFGKAHLTVDFPSQMPENISYAEYKEAGYRPYFTVVSPISLVGWDYNTRLGYPVLDNIRIVENEIVKNPENHWLSMDRKMVKIWYNTHIEVYRYNLEDDEWDEEPEIIPNTLGTIPLVTGYANKKGFMISEPPLEDLANVNLTHWQSSSDQRNILHIARVPFILASGFQSGELSGLEIGTNRVVTTTSSEADMKYVEHTGASIEAGNRDLADLESQMRVLGAELIMGKSTDRQTATAREIDQAEALSLMQLTIRSTARIIEQAYAFAGAWLGVDASSVEVEVGQATPQEPNPTNAMSSLKELNILTNEQFFDEMKRRGIISPDVDYDEKTIMEQRVKMAEMMAITNKMSNPEPEKTEEDSEEKNGGRG